MRQSDLVNDLESMKASLMQGATYVSMWMVRDVVCRVEIDPNAFILSFEICSGQSCTAKPQLDSLRSRGSEERTTRVFRARMSADLNHVQMILDSSP